MGRIVKKFLTIRQLADEIGIPVRSLRTLKAKGIIGGISLGHRTLFFDADDVRASLAKFKTRCVA